MKPLEKSKYHPNVVYVKNDPVISALRSKELFSESMERANRLVSKIKLPGKGI